MKSPCLKGVLLMHKLTYKLFLINAVADHTPQGYVSAIYVCIYMHLCMLMYHLL